MEVVAFYNFQYFIIMRCDLNTGSNKDHNLLRHTDCCFLNVVVFQTRVSFTLCPGSKFPHMAAINADEDKQNNTMVTTKPGFCTLVETR